MGKIINLKGQKFGRLTVIKDVGRNNHGSILWLCQCDCGNKKVVNSGDLRKGNVSSCGCIRKTQLLKHGDSGTRLYNIWCDIKKRCYNHNCVAYKNYGGRGIKVCNEWLNNYQSFKVWSLDNGYDDTLTIDRINNNGDYEPGNCRWVDMIMQANNTRKNVYIEYKGKIKTISQWSKILNMNPSTIRYRLNIGWQIEDVLTKSSQRKRTNK